MSTKLKKRLVRIIISLALFIPLFIVDKVIHLDSFFNWDGLGWILPFSLYLDIYLIISYDILQKAFRNIRHGQIFDENFLMIFATFGAFAIREFPEAVSVMILYQLGEFFQDLAVGKSRKEIASLMDLKADVAHVIKDDNLLDIDPEELEINTVIRILPGEKIPVDGIIYKGNTYLDNKALTGESVPVEVLEGSNVLSGSININNTIDVKVTKKYADSTVNKILELVENSSNVKSKQEKFITKFAKWYTPIVVIGAVLLALIGSLVTHNVYDWIARALNFLVVSCPCAIVISVPLSFFISLGRSAKQGILIKGSMYLENFNNAKAFVFDKTGTLTKGNFVVSKILPQDREKEILEAAAICESQSIHPIASAITKYNGIDVDLSYTLTNVPGKGVIATKDQSTYLCGNSKLMDDYNVKYTEISSAGTLIYVAKNSEFLGVIEIIDEIKEESYELISYLKKNNIKTIMLTGDNFNVAKNVSSNIGIDMYKYDLLPQDKVYMLDMIMKENKGLVAYVGDGINDAPTLARSDIGISMGGVGSDAAIEASDIVFMNDNLLNIIKAKKVASKTLRIVKENIAFALGVKLAILILSIIFPIHIWIAVFGDVGVALLCILNALRSGKIK